MRTAASTAEIGSTPIRRDREKPRFEFALPIPAREAPHSSDERFLNNILRVLPLAKHSIAQRINPMAKPIH